MIFTTAYNRQDLLAIDPNSALIVFAIIMLISILWWFLSRRHKQRASIAYFDSEAMDVAKASAELKMKHNYEELLPEHLLWALFDKPGNQLNGFLHQHGLDPLEGKKVLEQMFTGKRVDKDQNLSPQLHASERVKQIINQAGTNRERRKASKVAPVDLFEALLDATVSSNESIFDETKSFMNLVGVSSESILGELKKNSETIESRGNSLNR